MRSPLPFPCVPDRPYKILLVQVGTLSFSHPSFGVPVLFIYLFLATRAGVRIPLLRHPPHPVNGSILPRVELAATRTKEARCGYVTQKRPESEQPSRWVAHILNKDPKSPRRVRA